MFPRIESLEQRQFFSAVPTNAGFEVSVISSTIPSLVIGGKRVHGIISLQIEPNSGYEQKGIFEFVIDAERDGTVVPLAKVHQRLDVSAGNVSYLKVPVGPIGKITTAGSYTIYAAASDPSGNIQQSAAGPTLVAQPKTYGFSETLISSRDVSVFESDDYITGLVESFTLQIQNTGNVPTTGNMQIKLEQDDLTTAAVTYLSPVKIVRAISVAVGQSRLVTVKYKFTVGGVPGTGFTPVLAVSQDGVSESDDGDFVLSG